MSEGIPREYLYRLRVQAAAGNIQELGGDADSETAIARARQHHHAHNQVKVWVWDIRTGRTIFQLEPLDDQPVSREVYRQICRSQSVSAVQRAFRSGGVR